MNENGPFVAHEPNGTGWFTNTSLPKADIADWCRGYPGMRIEVGPPMVTPVTYTAEQMKSRKIVGLYVSVWPCP